MSDPFKSYLAVYDAWMDDAVGSAEEWLHHDHAIAALDDADAYAQAAAYRPDDRFRYLVSIHDAQGQAIYPRVDNADRPAGTVMPRKMRALLDD